MSVEMRVLDNSHPVDLSNASRRLPVVFCLDVSGSMRDNVKDLEEGVKLFLKECYNDQNAKYSCEIMIISFGQSVNIIQQFDTVDCIIQNGMPEYNLTASGYTPVGESVRLGLQMLDIRLEDLRRQGISCYTPWLVVMSDGYPEGSTAQETAERMAVLDEVSQELTKRVRHHTISVLSIGIGRDNNERVMDMLSPGRKSVHLQAYFDGKYKFFDFFIWMTSCVATESCSDSHNVEQLEPIDSWAEKWDNSNKTTEPTNSEQSSFLHSWAEEWGNVNTAAATKGNWKKSL